MKQCQEIKQNWTGRENFDICFFFCVIFDNEYQRLILKRHWVLGKASTHF